MKCRIRNGFVALLIWGCLLLGGGFVSVQAQTLPAFANGDANLPADPTTLLRAAQQVVFMIDQGLASELWPHVSEVIQQEFTKTEFEQKIYASRRPLGILVGRRWSMIMQADWPDDERRPAGLYVSIVYISDFTGKSGMTEEVVFRQDQDGIWRIAGYALYHG